MPNPSTLAAEENVEKFDGDMNGVRRVYKDPIVKLQEAKTVKGDKVYLEQDPSGKPAHSHGSKMDAGKPPVWRGVLNYFGKAVRAVSIVSLYGATKYQWKGWEGVEDGVARYADAIGRHLTDTDTVPTADADLPPMLAKAFPDVFITPEIVHAAQAAWNALATLELRLRGAGAGQSTPPPMGRQGQVLPFVPWEHQTGIFGGGTPIATLN